MIRIGLLSLSDGRERVHKNLSPAIEETARLIRKKLEETGKIEVISGK